MKPLTPEEKRVILDKGTEAPYTGKYYHNQEAGTYSCRQCDQPLYRSEDKFESGCGWPSFDDEIPGAVKRTTDADGRRVEITCSNCGGHLGHVFEGERFTPKNIRHCVNSVSLDFKPAESERKLSGIDGSTDVENPVGEADTAGAEVPEKKGKKEAIFAGGCFWGVEHLMKQIDGVKSVESGYIGGRTDNPSYEDVCYRDTGHAEAVRVVYDPSKVDYETLAKRFFEIHDPTQFNRQGPDIGNQYRSEVFYTDQGQKETALRLIAELREKGLDVRTQVTEATKFYPAEDYHQNYYERKGTQPYCHRYTPRF